MIFKEEEEMRPQNAFLKPLAVMVLMLLGVFISLHLFFSGFASKTQPTQTQNTNPTQNQPITQPITYEDLITQETEEKEPPKEEPKEEPKPKQEPKEEEPRGYYYITTQKTPPKTIQESIDLSPGPKIIYLP